MKIIKPDAISGEIMDLITSAKKEIIIITPYHEITGWDKLINKIKKAQSKDIKIIWYSRKDVKQKNPDELWKLFKIKPILISDLHAKIYLNEVNAVVTSLNLCKISDEKSTDIGHLTQNHEEYKDIYDFYEKYIKVPDSFSKIESFEKCETPFLETKKNGITTKISKTYAFNGIHEHIIMTYGNFQYKYIEDSDLSYYDFLKKDYKLYFEFYEKAIKIFIQIPNRDLGKLDFKKRVDHTRENIILSKELEFWDSKSSIKYFYKSNFIIKAWVKRQLDFFLKDLDTIIEIIVHK
jgi:hypothetical protein